MDKHAFIERVADEAKLSKEDVHAAIKAVTKVLTAALVKGERVMLPDFGTFEVRVHAGREIHNSRTGTVMKIESAKIPTLKAGQSLMDAINM